MKSKKKTQVAPVKKGKVCIVCGKPATRIVDGDPSCEDHAELVYEDQVEKYTQHHQADEEWLEKLNR